MKRVLLYFILIYLATTVVEAQDIQDVRLKHLTIKDGLSDNNVKDIVQDGFGYLWIATEYGLCRFDGKNIQRFFANGKIISLPGNNITHLKYLGDNELGISTSEGLLLLNTKTFAQQNYKVSDTGVISYYQNNVWDCVLLPDNRIGLTTCTGFYVFNRNGSLYFRYDRYTAADINRRLIWGKEIYQATPNKIVIIGENDNYAVYNSSTNHIELYQQKDAKRKEWPFLADPNMRRIKLSDTELLMANQNSDTVFYCDLKNGVGSPVKLPFPLLSNISWNAKAKFLNDTTLILNLISGGVVSIGFESRTKKLQFSSDRIYGGLRSFCHFIDKDKRLWIGTVNGLYGQQLQEMAVRKIAVPNLYAENTRVATVLSHAQKIFIGCFNKKSTALKVFSNKGDSLLREISFFDSSSDWNEVWSISPYKKDTLLLGTRAGVLWFSINDYKYGEFKPANTNNFFSQPFIDLQPPTLDGTMWLLVKHGRTVAKYNINTGSLAQFNSQSKPSFPISDVKHFVRDAEGNVWFGGRGLCRYNELTGLFDTLMLNFSGRNKYSSNITNLGADKDGGLWIQTGDNDLLSYDIKGRSFSVLKGSSGFPEGINHAMSTNTDSRIVIVQSNRVVDYDLRSNSYRIIGASDGLPSERPRSETPVFYDSIGGRYFLVYPKTVAIYSPLSKQSETKPRLAINEIVLNNKRHIYHPDSSIKISYKESKVTVFYFVSDFENAPEYIYYYKLDKNEWIFAETSSFIELGSVESGKHTILIKSIDPEGNEITVSQSIYVVPPFWEQWWVKLLLAILVFAVVVWLYRSRLHQVRNKAKLDKDLREIEMKALQVQMNPHFIFNALNSIKELILTDRKEEASRYLSKFGHLVRLNLEQNDQSFISLADNNRQLTSYLEMESLRFRNLNWKIKLDKDVDPDELLIPPMIIQPLVENAIWHGLLPMENERLLSIHYKKTGNLLYCEIEDNGIGINKAAPKKQSMTRQSVGLANTKNRLDLLREKYNEPFSISIIDKGTLDNKGAGTLAILSLPVMTQNE